MSAIIYLYGHGRRRHIAAGTPTEHGGAAFCGDWHMIDERMVEEARRWQAASVAERAIERKRQLPVCQRCESGARKAGLLAAADQPTEVANP